MRTLIVSDIHGNEAALRAVLREPRDRLVCLGDIVGYGPCPAACVELIRTEADIVVLGNHDNALVTGADPRCSEAFADLARATVAIGFGEVNQWATAWLRALPRWAYWTNDTARMLGVHATPSDPLHRYLAADPSAWDDEVSALHVDMVVCGHTHVPFSLRAGRVRVVNPGSAGQPKDGDPRAAYAIIEDGRVSFHRIEYPVEETVDALRKWHLPFGTETALAELLRTGQVPARLLSRRSGRPTVGDASRALAQQQKLVPRRDPEPDRHQ